MKRIAILLTLLATVLHAEEAATITIRKGDTTSVALKGLGGADGTAATKVLQNDLQLSSWFSITPPERATYIISGVANGGSLQGSVVDQRGSTVLQKTYSGPTRAATHKFADDIVDTLTGHKGIASSKIAFVSKHTGHKEIYTADYDGANVKQLTNDGVISVAPALSLDGSKLAYTGYQSGYADIYLIELASGARNRIIKFPGTNSGAAFSPDGARIACSLSKDGNPELYVVGANGGGARRLTRTPGVESSPTWSPDGSEIIYSSDERGGPQLFKISANGGSGQLISTGYGYCTEPSWSPDGRKVAFTARTGGFSIAVKDLQGGPSSLMASGEDPAWGADSRHLIFSSGSSIVLLDTQNGKQTPIITGLGEVSEPTWSH
ncbi:Tol-Pal system beta propeller repeat protein TolB [soil metagenome]